jgi:hypothetical protein
MNISPLDLQRLATTIAIFAGGGWAIWNYVRNRTHNPRLQIEVTAELVEWEGCHYLLARCTAKNVGLSLIRLPQPQEDGAGLPGTALFVRTMPRLAAEPDIIEVPWETEKAAFDIFTEHRAIEPGLMITEEKLIYLGVPKSDAYRVRLRVSAGNREHEKKREKWTAVAVAKRRSDPAELNAEKRKE